MESKLIPLLIVLALLTGCASTSTSEEAATAPVDVPVQTSGPTVTERPYESVSASVASIDDDGSVRLVIEGGLEASLWQEVSLGGESVFIVDDLADFTGEKGAFMSLSDDGTATLIGLDGPVEGEVMPITVLDGSYSLDEMVQGVFSLALSGGSIHEGLVCVSNSISDEVIQDLGINSIIVFSRPEDGGSLFSFLSSQGLVWEGPYSAQALEFMLANEGPFLIVSSEEDGLLCLPTVLACLMGSRASQIVDDYASALSLTAGQTRALSAQVDELLSLLNGGTLPSDASLLSMSTNHLNRDLGLSFDTIPSLRLHLR